MRKLNNYNNFDLYTSNTSVDTGGGETVLSNTLQIFNFLINYFLNF